MTSVGTRAQTSTENKIILNIAGQDGDDLCFRVKMTTLIGRLKKNYSERTGLPISSIEFIYNGRRMCDDETPQRLELKDYDSIKVVEKFAAYRRVLLALENLSMQTTHFDIFNRNEMTDDLVQSCLGPEASAMDKLFVKLADRLKFMREFGRLCSSYDNEGKQKKEHILWTSNSQLEQPTPHLSAITWRESTVESNPGSSRRSRPKPRDRHSNANVREDVKQSINVNSNEIKTENSSRSTKTRRSRSSRPRLFGQRHKKPKKKSTCYTLAEETEMLRYICDNKKFGHFSLSTWKEVKRLGLFPKRTAGALYTHFRTSMLKRLDEFDCLSPEDLENFREAADTVESSKMIIGEKENEEEESPDVQNNE